MFSLLPSCAQNRVTPPILPCYTRVSVGPGVVIADAESPGKWHPSYPASRRYDMYTVFNVLPNFYVYLFTQTSM